MINLQWTQATDLGPGFTSNSDALFLDERLKLFVLCDGVGNEKGASIVAQSACRLLRDYLQDIVGIFQDFEKDSTAENRRQVSEALRTAVRMTSKKIWDMGLEDKSVAGFTTTLDYIVFAGGYAFVVHVGDGRVYLHRGGALHLLTVDHNYCQELVSKEQRSLEEARRHRFSSALTRCVGGQRTVDADVIEVEISSADSFLICSDGIYRNFDDITLGQFCESGAGVASAEALVAEGKRLGAKENLSAIFIHAERGVGSPKSLAVQKIQALKNLHLLQYMTYHELLKLVAVGQLKTFFPQGQIFLEGHPAGAMAIVVSGKVEVQKRGRSLAVLGPGASIGEMSFVQNSRLHGASVVATVETIVLEYTRESLYGLFRREEAIAVKFFWALSRDLAERLRGTTEQLVRQKSMPA